jgi:asparaginyl-tRNA synthetase
MFNLRSSGKIHFLQFRDGTGAIQAIISKNDVGDEAFDQVKDLTQESSIILTGQPKVEPRSPSGYDLLVTQVKVIQKAAEDYPISNKAHGTSFLLDNRHFWLRSQRQQAIQLIRNQIIYAIYDFYRQNGFIKIDTPILTPNACEGTTTLFEVDYFGTPSYLSQSGQLYLEAAIFAFNRVFDFSPVFRAEKSKTRRHLIEFWMNNTEAAFVEHKENLEIQENLIVHILSTVLNNNRPLLQILERDISKLENIKTPFPRLPHFDAVKKLKSLGSDIGERDDLGADDETLLMNKYDQPVFVEFYPAEVKAFYMKRHPEYPDRAMCADLLAPEGYGEVIGGSQREDNYDTLLASIKQHNLPVEAFSWYLDLRRYGSVPHSGFGIGLERLVAWICGLKHVRETIPFPRLINRLTP